MPIVRLYYAIENQVGRLTLSLEFFCFCKNTSCYQERERITWIS